MSQSKPEKVTVQTLAKMANKGAPEGAARQKIAMVTAYDATFARLLDAAGCDVLLVGDSLGMVVKGEASTLSVTVEEMIYHLRAVARGSRRAQIVGDMPFMSYQGSLEDGMRNAGRLIKDGGAEAVKLEGGAEYAELVRRLAGEVTRAVGAATIGIGAGPDCDGQVLVSYDLLGMNDEFRPKFVRRYEQLGVRIRTAVEAYVNDVRAQRFPDEEHSFGDAASPRTDATPYAPPSPAATSPVPLGDGSAEADAIAAGCIPLPVRPANKT